jgi:hypothetical protein
MCSGELFTNSSGHPAQKELFPGNRVFEERGGTMEQKVEMEVSSGLTVLKMP